MSQFNFSQKIFDPKPGIKCGNCNFDDYEQEADIPDYAYILFDDICDIIGPAEEWPVVIRTLFWTPGVTHFNRMKLCAFVVVNGLHPEVFMEWVDLMGVARNTSSRREFISWLTELTTNPYKWRRVYAFHVLNHQYEFVTGEIKLRLSMSDKPS